VGGGVSSKWGDRAPRKQASSERERGEALLRTREAKPRYQGAHVSRMIMAQINCMVRSKKVSRLHAFKSSALAHLTASRG
jgi:hypothetical protein